MTDSGIPKTQAPLPATSLVDAADAYAVAEYLQNIKAGLVPDDQVESVRRQCRDLGIAIDCGERHRGDK